MAYGIGSTYQLGTVSPGTATNYDAMEEKGTTSDGRGEDDGIVKDARKWKAELDYSKQFERDWLLEAEDYYENYKCESKKSDSFPILNSNTELLRQATYNSCPSADIRRRFRDEDVVGKAICDVLERGIDFENEEYDLNHDMQMADLDMLIAGRAITRIEYHPVIVQMPKLNPDGTPVMKDKVDDEGNPIVGQDGKPEQEPDTTDQKTDESCPTKHVQWNEFRRGPGKTWDEVPWVAFMHRLTKEEVLDQFGDEVAENIKFEELEISNKSTGVQKENTDLFQTVEVWEIWDKPSGHVYFVSIAYEGYLKDPVADPLKLKKFFPMPRPLMAMENTTDLKPIPPYRVYKQQAIELNRATNRLNKLVTAFRVRGVYAAQFAEVGKMLSANDLDMIPVQNAQGIEAMGGLGKAIWIMPLADLAAAIDKLFSVREQIVQSIYQITGLADIMRATSNPEETATAASIKTQWGSLRLQRLQKEVQRYARDLMRLKAEIMCLHYDVSTLQNISGLKFAPTPAPAQPPIPGQPPAPQVADWQSMQAVMKSEQMRDIRIDVETDSTIQQTINRDMRGLSEVIGAVTELIKEGTPLVMSKAMPFGAFKELIMTVIRHAEMGRAVEDAFDSMVAPSPPPPTPPPEEVLNQIRSAKDQFIKVAEEHTMQVQQSVDQSTQMAQTAQAEASKAEQLHQATTEAAGHVIAHTANQEGITAGFAQIQQQFAIMQQELAKIASQIHATVAAPKVVSFHKDNEGKIIGAAALPVIPQGQ